MIGYIFSNQFKKDIKLAEKRRYNTDELFDIVVKIIWEEPLPEYCREHKLHGDLDGYTECHVKGDRVIIYYFCEEGVVFSRTGTHSDLL